MQKPLADTIKKRQRQLPSLIQMMSGDHSVPDFHLNRVFQELLSLRLELAYQLRLSRDAQDRLSQKLASIDSRLKELQVGTEKTQTEISKLMHPLKSQADE